MKLWHEHFPFCRNIAPLVLARRFVEQAVADVTRRKGFGLFVHQCSALFCALFIFILQFQPVLMRTAVQLQPPAVMYSLLYTHPAVLTELPALLQHFCRLPLSLEHFNSPTLYSYGFLHCFFIVLLLSGPFQTQLGTLFSCMLRCSM